MQYVQFNSDNKGKAHFVPVVPQLNEANYRPPAPLQYLSQAYEANVVQFIRVPFGWAGNAAMVA